ncbi:MAG: hypothetical protein C1O27_002544 [Chloroflexi bacterium]|jgi:hypothetical protein|nr:MAG: hypothetical protein C1O27_002544 [Chloroflexota bacterium]
MARKNGKTIESYEKDQRALELRKRGLTYDKISRQLGYATPSASYKAVTRRLRDMDKPAVAMLRELEVQRLDEMLSAVWVNVLQGDAGAVSTALKISERRSRLLGLDAPHTIEARTRVDVLSWNQAIRDFITLHKEVFGDGLQDERTATLAKRIDELVTSRLENG